MVSLSLSRQDASNHMQLDLRRLPRDLDLRSNFELDRSRVYYTCFDASWRGKHDGVKITALSLQTRKLSKNGFAKNAVFYLSWPPTPKWILGEIWGHFSERVFQELSSVFFNFDVALIGTEIMRIIWSHVMWFGNFGRFRFWWHLVTSIFPSHKMTLVLLLELVNPRPAGVFSRTRPAGGGADSAPLPNSRTNRRSEAGEAAIESPEREDSNAH